MSRGRKRGVSVGSGEEKNTKEDGVKKGENSRLNSRKHLYGGHANVSNSISKMTVLIYAACICMNVGIASTNV